MSVALPFVSIIIAARPGQAEVKAVDASRQLDYPKDRLEIIVARGTQPSIQRNTAIRAAQGELIYFLDDDSVPRPDNLKRMLPHFARPEAVMLGGPNLCPPEAPPLEHAFAQTMGNALAFGPSRARYTPVGSLRESSEKELILCNLMARRAALLDAGCFDEALYPNEENALMDDLQKRGGKLLYDPEFVVHRRPRQNLRAFMKMLMTYGRGRAEQFRLHPTAGSALNFAPPLFCLYLLGILVAGWLLPKPAFFPLWLYMIIVWFSAIKQAWQADRAPLKTSGLIFISHLCYGLGFWRGLFTPLKQAAARTPAPVSLEHIPLA